jgi:hypothetical protein
MVAKRPMTVATNRAARTAASDDQRDPKSKKPKRQ